MSNLKFVLIVFAIVFFPALGIKGCKTYYAMRAFNRLTDGPKATFVDALCSDLRITTR